MASVGVATVALQPVLRTAVPASATPPLDRPPAASPTPPVTSPTPSRTAPASTTPPQPGGTARTPSPTGVSTVDGWIVTTGADGQPVYTRSFRLGGGQAVIRMSAGRVRLVTATPNPGYSVDTVQNEPGNLAVQFTAPNHYFIIHAVWNNGPFAQVSEAGG